MFNTLSLPGDEIENRGYDPIMFIDDTNRSRYADMERARGDQGPSMVMVENGKYKFVVYSGNLPRRPLSPDARLREEEGSSSYMGTG